MEEEHKLKLQAELLESKMFLQAVIDTIRDEIIVIDRAYRINGANEALVKRLGKTKHEIISEYCYRVLHNMDKPCDMLNHYCPMQDILKTAAPCGVLYTHFKGLEVGCDRVVACPALEDLGVVTQLVVMGGELPEAKKSPGKLFDAQMLSPQGKLANAVAHELNNPLAVILGFTDLLMEKMDSDSQSHEILKAIERQAQSCKRIVECLSIFTRYPEATEYSTDVNANLERMISVIENILVAKKIILDKNLAKNLPKAKGDMGGLRQVFMNLATNAIAAMNRGGYLTVSTRLNTSGNRLEILFKDTGHGIKREYRDKIFDPFFTTRKAKEGAGLGLSVSYDLVSKYGGDITFETVAEEEDRERKGTTFKVSLPVASLVSEKISD
jgi:signal transduction histidine kinase